jgi:hypothetical protein
VPAHPQRLGERELGVRAVLHRGQRQGPLEQRQGLPRVVTEQRELAEPQQGRGDAGVRGAERGLVQASARACFCSASSYRPS